MPVGVKGGSDLNSVTQGFVVSHSQTLFKSAAGKGSTSEIQFFNAKEEQLLCRFYEKKLSDLCAFLKVSNRVRVRHAFPAPSCLTNT